MSGMQTSSGRAGPSRGRKTGAIWTGGSKHCGGMLQPVAVGRISCRASRGPLPEDGASKLSQVVWNPWFRKFAPNFGWKRNYIFRCCNGQGQLVTLTSISGCRVLNPPFGHRLEGRASAMVLLTSDSHASSFLGGKVSVFQDSCDLSFHQRVRSGQWIESDSVRKC